MTYDVTVSIVSWNSREMLERCLCALYKAGTGISLQVIVVDNHSSDGSAAFVRDTFPEVTLIENKRNRGYACANNQAFALARGKYFLLLNPDVFVTGQSLSAMTGFLDSRSEAAGVVARYLNPDGSFQCFYRRWPRFPVFLCSWADISRWIPGSYKRRVLSAYRYELPGDTFDSSMVIEQPGASCLMVRTDIIRRIGLFDEQFPLFFNDVDFCRRLTAAGYRLFYLPDAPVVHELGAGHEAGLVWIKAEFYIGWLRYLKKYGNLFPGVMARMIMMIDCLVLGCQYIAQSLLRRDGRHATLVCVAYRIRALADLSAF